MPAIEPSTTSVPSPVPSTGAMKASPQGRLPKAPRSFSSPASTIAVRPSSPSRRSLPRGQVIRASAPRVERARDRCAAPAQRRMSAPITRASISSVTPGIEATRAPASVAALRAAVWESDWIVGARTTSAASIAAATVAGGSAACESRSEITASVASRALALRVDPQQRPELFGDRVADHQHLLAGLQAQAIADHRPHRPVQSLGHRPRLCASASSAIRRHAIATITVPAGVAQLVRAAES